VRRSRGPAEPPVHPQDPLGGPDEPAQPAITAFFTDGLGFKVSDRISGVGAFMRCSTDHHNLLVLAAPVSFLHPEDLAAMMTGAHSAR